MALYLFVIRYYQILKEHLNTFWYVFREDMSNEQLLINTKCKIQNCFNKTTVAFCSLYYYKLLKKSFSYYSTILIQRTLNSTNILANIFYFPRRVQRNNFLSSKTSSKDVLKSSSRRVCKKRLQEHTLQLCLEDVLMTS